VCESVHGGCRGGVLHNLAHACAITLARTHIIRCEGGYHYYSNPIMLMVDPDKMEKKGIFDY